MTRFTIGFAKRMLAVGSLAIILGVMPACSSGGTISYSKGADSKASEIATKADNDNSKSGTTSDSEKKGNAQNSSPAAQGTASSSAASQTNTGASAPSGQGTTASPSGGATPSSSSPASQEDKTASTLSPSADTDASKKEESPNAYTLPSESEPSKSANGSTTNNQASESASTSSPSSASPEKNRQSAVLDLSDEADRVLLNEYLCWLSLGFDGDASIDSIKNDTVAQVKFAINYIGLTSPNAIERGDYTSVAGRGGGAQAASNARVSADAVKKVTEKFFGTTPDWNSLDRNQAYTYHDGEIYFGTTAPFGQSPRWSAATAVQKTADGTYLVSFDTYRDPSPYSVRDKSFYKLDSAGMARELHAEKACSKGTATLNVSEQNGKKAFELVGYSSSPVAIVEPEDVNKQTDDVPANPPKTKQDFVNKYNDIKRDKENDRRFGGTTMDMIQVGNEFYERYDELINELYGNLNSQPSVDSEKLRASQEAWEKRLQERLEATKAEYAGGSLMGPAVLGVNMEEQEARIDELIAMLP